MALFKKNKKDENKKAENGEVIDLNPKKPGKAKNFVKKALIGIAAAGVGVVAFCAVGVAMAAAVDSSSDTVEADDDEITVSDEDSPDNSEAGTSEYSEE